MKKPDISKFPNNPGVYKYINKTGKIIYVGKAKNLKKRLSSYWSNQKRLPLRISNMLNEANSIEWIVVQSEVEALNLEWSYIKEYSPKYNIDFNFDDSSYSKLAFTTNEDFPRLFITRKTTYKNTKYLGPFPKSWAIKNSVEYLKKVYPVRTCNSSIFNNAKKLNRNCLLGDIGKCSAPCVGKIDKESYNKLFNEFLSFFKGNALSLIKNLEKDMKRYSEIEEFEKAAKIRDNIESFKTISEKNSVVAGLNESFDIIVVVIDDVESAYCHLIVRNGTIKAEISSILERAESADEKTIFELLLLKTFENYPDYDLPKVVFSNIEVSQGAKDLVIQSIRKGEDFSTSKFAYSTMDKKVSTEKLPNSNFPTPQLTSNPDISILDPGLSTVVGAKMKFQIPLRGQKKALLDIAIKNANEKLRLEKMKHATSLIARTQGLNEIAEYLELPKAPFRIEGYDISHTLGENQVASMVVFEDGKPNKKEYRKFIIKEAFGDVPSIKEVIERRFTNQTSKFQELPDLIIIDGAKPQADGANEVLKKLEIDIPVIGLAKRLEEVWTTYDDMPIIFSRGSKALYILQQVRDESHRFAISFHRKVRSRKTLSS